MSGHSKWANIRRRKEVQDAKRGKTFGRLAKELSVAAREGGTDPASNARLRLAVQNARHANMSKENINKAIKKGERTSGVEYRFLTYEGYASAGVAVYVECMSDNPHRTAPNIRHAFDKYGGNLGTSGSLDFLFDRKGIFDVFLGEKDEDECLLKLIDLGVEHAENKDDILLLTFPFEVFGNVQKAIEALGMEIKNTAIIRVPKTTVQVTKEEYAKILRLLEALDDDEDVQEVFHNMEESA